MEAVLHWPMAVWAMSVRMMRVVTMENELTARCLGLRIVNQRPVQTLRQIVVLQVLKMRSVRMVRV